MGRPSGGSGSGDRGSSDEALRRMSKLVSSLLARADCGPFREPVDWRGLELWDYPKVIKKMMDLGTVKRKLERSQYANAAACAEDVRLVWTNCKTYNADGSDFYLLAESFSKRFEDRYRKIRAEFDTGEDDQKGGPSSRSSSTAPAAAGGGGGSSSSHSTSWDPSAPPPLDIKAKFASNLFRLNGDELGHVMQVLDLRCPNAIERIGDRTKIQTLQHPDSGGDGANNNNNNNNNAAMPYEEMEINVEAIDVKTFQELDRYVKDKLYAKEKFHQMGGASGTAGAGGHHDKVSSGGMKRKR